MFLRKIKYEKKYLETNKKNFLKFFDCEKRYILFITNDNFGGTRQYEEIQRKKLPNLLVLRRISYGERPDVIFELEDNDIKSKKYFHANELQKIFSLNYQSIILNTLVHVSNYQSLMNLIISYKKNHKECYILYLVHDFHSVCPNCNLFVNGHYCKLDCEKEHCKLFIADSRVSLNDWRMNWNKLFSISDEIRCFSESSKRIILDAYKDVNQDIVTVIPHDILHIKFKHIQGIDKLPLHIGIIGSVISDFKGKEIVKDLIVRYGDDFPISLVGSEYKFYKLKRDKVKYLGPYEHDNLEKIIRNEKISLVIFPSLWPETFSYVVSELICMDIPIISFNIGAQADKVKKYSKGIVCADEKELFEIVDKMIEVPRNS